MMMGLKLIGIALSLAGDLAPAKTEKHGFLLPVERKPADVSQSSIFSKHLTVGCSNRQGMLVTKDISPSLYENCIDESASLPNQTSPNSFKGEGAKSLLLQF